MIEGEEFLCPHCGAAIIPQFTPAQLRLLNQEEETHYLVPTAWGCGLGLLLGIGCMVLVFILLAEPFDLTNGDQRRLPGIPLVFSVLGGALAAMIAFILAKRNRERMRKK
jgi:hypothetical protein